MAIRPDKYILRDKIAIPCDDLMEWGRQYENSDNRIVVKTNVGDTRISTVFLGLDYAWGDGPPLLFETLVFGGPNDPNDQYEKRCSTWAQAEKQHAEVVALVQSGVKLDDVDD